MGQLSGKTAIISGGSDGIGRAIAAHFATLGARIIICARNAGKLEATTDAITRAGGQCETRIQDVADAQGYAAMIEEIAGHSGLDILVNNAPHVGMGMIADTDLAAFRQNFVINMDAAFLGSRAAMAHMAEKGGGAIVNISSINAARALAGMAGYSAAKAALVQFTKVAAMEGARQNIRVNAIAPGPIMTPGTEAWFKSDPAAGDAIAQANPMGRIGTPLEVAQVAAFLASDQASYVTGATIPVDGGKANELYVPG